MNTFKRVIILSLGLCLGLFAQKLTLQGSTTILPIAQAAAEAYMEKHPDADIMVRGGGSGTGIAALIDGATDIANSSRPMKTKEMKQAREKGVNPVGTVIALDGIAVIVHKSNPINDITIDDLKKIYTGKMTNWSSLGAKGKIVVVSRDAASGTFEVFNEKVLTGAKLTESALMQASNLEIARTVEQTPGGIGYVGLGYISDKVKVLKVNGVTPSEQTVRNGSYPLARPLYMYTNGAPKGLAKSFIDFILSNEGQKIVRDNGFVPVK
jgi:phosphate transport system substrate-binding protein